jgi:WD40 repeat protein
MHLWDVVTGEEVQQFVGHTPDARANLTYAFSPDGHTIFSTSGDQTARLWDVENGDEIRQFEGAVTGRWESATFSPDGKYVLAGGGNGVLHPVGADNNPVLMWDVETGEAVRQFVGHTQLVFSLGVSPDGRYLATTSFDNSARLWDMETGEEVRRFAPYPTWTYGAAFSPDGRFLLSGGGSSYARLLNVESGEVVLEFDPDVSALAAGRVDYSPDGRLVVTAGPSATVVVWDTETGKQLRVFDAVANQLDSVAFSPDGKYVLTGTLDNVTRLWPVSIEDTVALACSKMTRDFTAQERAKYGLGEGAACPST